MNIGTRGHLDLGVNPLDLEKSSNLVIGVMTEDHIGTKERRKKGENKKEKGSVSIFSYAVSASRAEGRKG